MRSLYTQEFLFHFRNQPYRRKLKKHTHSAEAYNKYCGDEIKVQILIKDGIIKDIGYDSDGCAISLGAMSILSNYIVGKNINDVRNISKENFIKMLKIDLTPTREKCALVGYNALMNALNRRSRNG